MLTLRQHIHALNAMAVVYSSLSRDAVVTGMKAVSMRTIFAEIVGNGGEREAKNIFLVLPGVQRR